MEMKMRLYPLSGLWPVLVVGGSFLAGGLAGSMVCAFLSGESVRQVELYLRDYMELVRSGSVARSAAGSAWHHGRWFLVCGLLGFTGLGTAAVPLLFGLRGFLLAFGISCFFRFFGAAGLFPAVCLFLLPALLWAPGLFRVGAGAFRAGLHRLRRGRGEVLADVEKNSPPLAGAVCCVLFFLCVLYEWGALPVLLPLAARILG